MPDTPFLAPPDLSDFMAQIAEMRAEAEQMMGFRNLHTGRVATAMLPDPGKSEVTFGMVAAAQRQLDRMTQSVFTRRSMLPIPGVKIIESELMTITVEDWSGVRSPSRARRRMKRGHRQNIRYVQAPDPKLIYSNEGIFGHPATIAKVLQGISVKKSANVEDTLLKGMFG